MDKKVYSKPVKPRIHLFLYSLFFLSLLSTGSLKSQVTTYDRIPLGTSKLKVGDRLQFTIQTPSTQTPSSIYGGYNSRTLNWSMASGSVFTSEYIVSEGDPDQASPVDLTDVTFTDVSGSSTVCDWSGLAWGIDAHAPKVLSMSVPNGSKKVGDVVPIVIKTDDGGELYSLSQFTVNQQAYPSARINFISSSNTDYTIEYTIASGDLDVSVGAIQLSLVLVDGAGNKNEAFTTLSPNSLSIYANPPFITSLTSVASSSTSLRIGDKIVFSLAGSGVENGLKASGSYNGQVLNWVQTSGSNFSAEYLVTEQSVDQFTPVQISGVALTDAGGNMSSPASGADVSLGIDAHRPVVLSIVNSLSGSTPLKIGDQIRFTLNTSSNESGANVVGSYNGRSLVWSEVSGTSFSAEYTVVEGDADQLIPLPIQNVSITDVAGNETVSGAYSVSSPIDAHRPAVVSLTSDASSAGMLKIGDRLHFSMATGVAETGLTVNSVYNGTALMWSKVGATTYTSEYLVSSSVPSSLNPVQLTGLTVVDQAGNVSLPFDGTDVKKGIASQFPSTLTLTSSTSETAPCLKIGDALDFKLSLDVPSSGATINASYNGVKLAWTEQSPTVYISQYVVNEGDVDQLGALNLTDGLFTDVYGNSSTFSGADVAKAIDAHRPVISSITSNATVYGTLKVGDKIKFVLSTTAVEPSATITSTYNAKPLLWTSSVGNTYTAEYVVALGDNDQTVLPLQISGVSIVDKAGNIGSVSMGSDIKKMIYANPPSIASVTATASASSKLKIGDKIVFTVSGSGVTSGLKASGTFNGQVLNWVQTGGANFSAEYVVTESSSDLASPVQLSGVVLTDAGGNVSAPVSSNSLNVSIDAHRPVISSLTEVPSGSNPLIVGDRIKFSLVSASAELGGVVSGSYNGHSLVWTQVSASLFTADYTVNLGDTNQSSPLHLTGVYLTDASGNVSDPANGTGNTNGIDANPPSIISLTSDATKSGMLKIGDKISFLLITSTPESGAAIFANYRGTSLAWTQTSSFTYTAEYVVPAGAANVLSPVQLTGVIVKDAAGNASLPFDGSDIRKGIAALAPSLQSLSSNVSSTGSLLKIGDVISFSLKTNLPSSGASIDASYNGHALIWTEVSSTEYTAQYDVTEGDPDQTTALQLLSLKFTDVYGNSATISGSDVTKPIDAHRPVITAIVSDATTAKVLKVGDEINFSLSTASAENSANILASYNGKALVWTKLSSTLYTSKYIVAANDNDCPMPVQLTNVKIYDAAGNLGLSYSGSDIVRTIDATQPQVVSITSLADHAGVLKVGDHISFILKTNPSDPLLTISPTSYNGHLLTWITLDGGAAYTSTYTVAEGDADRSTPLQLGNVVLTDKANNASSVVSATGLTNTIDAHSPVILQMSVNAGMKIIGSKAVITITTDNGGEMYSVDFLEVNGITYPSSQLTFVPVSKTSYVINYVVAEGDKDVSSGNLSVKIRLYDKAGNKSSLATNLLANTVSVYASRPTGDLRGGGSVCADQTATVNFIFSGTAPYDLAYSIDGVDASVVSGITEDSYSFVTTTSGAYKIVSLTDVHGNKALNIGNSVEVVVHALPTVNFTLKSAYNVMDTTVALHPNVQGGTFSGPGIIPADSTFHPSLVAVGGPYAISYAYTDANGCSNTAVRYVSIRKTTGSFENLKSTYCLNDSIQPIKAIVTADAISGGKFTGVGVTPLGGVDAEFYPLAAGPGDHVVSFSYIDKDGVDYVINQKVYVNDTVNASIANIPTSYCQNAGVLRLRGVPQDAKGVFSGLGITDLGNGTADFDPQMATIGSGNSVMYVYKESENCTSHVLKSIFVNPTPVVDYKIYDMDAVVRADSVCSSKEQIYLKGTPAGGSFTGGNVLNFSRTDSVIFLPVKFPTGGIKTITYQYSDPLTKCSNIISKDIKVLTVPTVGIQNISRHYCLNDPDVSFIGMVDGASASTGKFYFDGSLVNNNTGEALFRPNSPSDYSIKFEFTTTQGCVATKDSTVTVYDLPKVQFNNLSAKYCTNDAAVSLTGFPGGGNFLIGTTVFVDPVLFKPSDYQGALKIKYTYTDANQCSNSQEYPTVVYPSPVADFSAPGSCYSDSIIFNNLTVSSDAVKKWTWDFDDPSSLGKNTSSLANPKHYYFTGGSKTVKLTTTTVNGCSNEVSRSILLTDNPHVNFVWKNECMGTDPVLFTGSTTETVSDWSWYLGDGKKEGKKSFSYTYSKPGSYTVSLVGHTQNGCRDSISHVVNIRPTIAVDLANPYHRAFSSGAGGWIKESDVDSINSWTLGLPKGSTIKPIGTDNVWYTALDVQKHYKEQSWVSSPCFDFSNAQKPMLNMQIWSAPNKGRDGVVVQYKSDTASVWSNLGSELDGINWYNATEILGNPGQQLFGQKGWSNATFSAWTDARQSLDVVKGLGRVRFRIAYGSDGSTPKAGADGFAFDHVRIFERSKIALVEHFTNSSSLLCFSRDTSLRNTALASPLDVVDIHYHVKANISGVDSLQLMNAADPSARLLYYGINEVPFTNLRGLSRIDFINNLKDSIAKVILSEPLFSLTQEAVVVGGKLQVTAKITALAAIPDPVSLHVAVLEDNVFYPSAGNGQKYFRNVLRNMLPNAGGTNFIDPWKQGDTKSVNLEWSSVNYNKAANLRLVAFVQNEITKEVYQANVFNKKIDLVDGFDDVVGSLSQSEFIVYPNPAQDHVTLLLGEPAKHGIKLTLVNPFGQVAQTAAINQGDDRLELDLSSCRNGLYLLKLIDKDGHAAIKKLIVDKR